VKKDCYGCRALHEDALFPSCGLRFRIGTREKRIEGVGVINVPTPLEECPKPRTWKAWNNTPSKQEQKS